MVLAWGGVVDSVLEIESHVSASESVSSNTRVFVFE